MLDPTGVTIDVSRISGICFSMGRFKPITQDEITFLNFLNTSHAQLHTGMQTPSQS